MGSNNSKRVAHLSRDERRWLDSQDPNQIAALITAARKSQSINGIPGLISSSPVNNQNQQYNNFSSSSKPNHYVSATTVANGNSYKSSNQVKLSPYNHQGNNHGLNWQMQSLNNHQHHQTTARTNNTYNYNQRHNNITAATSLCDCNFPSGDNPSSDFTSSEYTSSELLVTNLPPFHDHVSDQPQQQQQQQSFHDHFQDHSQQQSFYDHPLDQLQQQRHQNRHRRAIARKSGAQAQPFMPNSRRNQVKNKTFLLAAGSNHNTGRLLTSDYQQNNFNNISGNILNYSSNLNNNNNNNNNNNYNNNNIMAANMEAESQRGLNFTRQQRAQLGIVGMLPPAHQDKDLQIKWVINYLEQNCGQDPLCKYVFLRNLKDFNETLFYATLMSNVELLMPIVYTPVVGLACQKFSSIFMKPRGLFISLQDSGNIGELLANWAEKDVRVIVVTDGERILGLGDLGANGMGISIGKLSLYTALAGVPPKNVLPITLDVGTNNMTNLADPFYIGLRQKRIRGSDYVNFIDEFMHSVVDRWGRSCLIQFEDFGNQNAFNLLERYRDSYCTFNDDIQGTASVCLSGLLSATKIIYKRLSGMRFLFYGSGEANLGTANLLLMAMVEQGMEPKEAKSKIWLVDSKGLLVTSRTDLTGHKRTYAQEGPQLKELLEIVEFVKPSAIIGASAQGGAFNESICNLMVQLNDRPIIFALSNPTSKAECTAQQAYEWTQGRCIFASGSPFEPVEYNGQRFITGQGNNAYIFPAIGLAAIAGHMHTIPEEAFLVAASALSDMLTQAESAQGLVYPSLTRIRDCTLKIAARLLEYFYSERLATYRPEPTDKVNFLKSIQYNANYPNIPNEPITTSSTSSISPNQTTPTSFD